VQPSVIFDKSALQMLRTAEVEELSRCFDLVCPPTLIREIISDLKKPSSSSGRVPENVVRVLAGRMRGMHLTTPVNFRKAALGDLRGATVPMAGTVPVDPDARNVHASPDGRQVLYDSTIEQQLWHRWSTGNFSTDDAEIATLWRDGLSKVNMKAVGNKWRDFLDNNIGRTASIEEIVERVDRLINFPARDIQTRMVAVFLTFLRADANVAAPFALSLVLDQRTTLATFAPYAASILRLYLTFIAAVSYSLIQLRASNYADLQYMFYAPFCMGFASNDKIHHRLWCAASGPAIFINGERLKNDLARRAEWRAGLTEEERKEHYATHSHYPVEIEGSIVNEIWAKWMIPREIFVQRLRARRPLEEVEAEIGPELRRRIEEMKAVQSQKDPAAGEWPLGPSRGDETPML
jgi:hypothetical protein